MSERDGGTDDRGYIGEPAGNTGIGNDRGADRVATATPDSTGGKSQARRVAQAAGGTGTSGHSGTGAEDTTATPGRVSAGSTGGGGFVGGSAMGDDGIGDTEGGLARGIGGTGGSSGRNAAGGGSSATSDDRLMRDNAGGKADR